MENLLEEKKSQFVKEIEENMYIVMNLCHIFSSPLKSIMSLAFSCENFVEQYGPKLNPEARKRMKELLQETFERTLKNLE